MYLCTGVSGAALSLLTWSRAVSSVNAESISTNCVLGIEDFFGLKVTQEWVGGGALWQECGREGGLITCFTHRAEIQHLLYWVTGRAGEGGRREATQNFNIFKHQQTVSNFSEEIPNPKTVEQNPNKPTWKIIYDWGGTLWKRDQMHNMRGWVILCGWRN